jgi:tRNA threonylcarbamoyladenosine biosynthesis protein TsaE
VHIRTQSERETEDFGARLAAVRPHVRPAFAVLYLTGELGSGKTTFARGFARGSGVEAPVRSPTYTLLEHYPGSAGTLVHLDLYRLKSPAEIDTLGLREWALAPYLWLIEWPEHGAGRLPAADLTLRFAASKDAHDIDLTAGSALGAAWLVSLESALRTP